MNTTQRLWALLCIVLAVSASAYTLSGKYTRTEAKWTPHYTVVAEQAATLVLDGDGTNIEYWFIKREIKALNGGDEIYNAGRRIVVPQYKLYTGGRKMCGDVRNWHVAVMKGLKYGVAPWYGLAVRSHENPSPHRDHFAYGVVIKKGTDLWTQAEWGFKILARLTPDPMKPDYDDMYQCCKTYVGPNSRWARERWTDGVYSISQRLRGLRE